MKKPIIDNPGGANWMQRLSQGGVTLLFWGVFGLLFRPVLTVLAWLLGGHFVSEAMVHHPGYQRLLEVAGMYLLVIACLALLLLGWANYNLLRFRHNERRTRHPDSVSMEAQAAFYGLEPAALGRFQQQRRMVLQIDEQGRPVLEVSECISR